MSDTLGLKTANIEERRASRRSLGAVEVSSVLKGSDDWRFHYTIKEAIEHSEIWFANLPDGTLVDFTSKGRWVSPFWPHEDIAKRAVEEMKVPDGETNPMPLDHWVDTVLNVECRADDCLIALCVSDGYADLKTVDEVLCALKRYQHDPQAFWEEHFSDDRFYVTQNLKAGPKGRLPE